MCSQQVFSYIILIVCYYHPSAHFFTRSPCDSRVFGNAKPSATGIVRSFVRVPRPWGCWLLSADDSWEIFTFWKDQETLSAAARKKQKKGENICLIIYYCLRFEWLWLAQHSIEVQTTLKGRRGIFHLRNHLPTSIKGKYHRTHTKA